MRDSFVDIQVREIALGRLPIRLGIWHFSHPAVVAGPRPVFDVFDETVLDRVVMDVIDVSLEVALVANLMLPEAPLPDAPFAFAAAGAALV
jgi:hypothetical protein